jgi:hypothetical protein
MGRSAGKDERAEHIEDALEGDIGTPAHKVQEGQRDRVVGKRDE